MKKSWSWERNLRLYRVLRVIGDLFLIGPVWMIFCLDELHLSYTFIFWSEMLCVVVAVGFGIVIGTIGDRLGRKKSLLLGESLILLGMVELTAARGGGLYLLSDVTVTFGFLFSGPALSALLKDSLHRLGRADEYRQEFGRANVGFYLALAVSCETAGRVMAAIGARAVFVVQCLALLVALALVTRLREPSWSDQVPRQVFQWYELWRQNRVVLAEELKEAGRTVRGNGAVKALLLFSAGGLISFGHLFYPPFFQYIALPKALYGRVFAGFNVFCALVSLVAPWWRRHVSERQTFAAILGGRVMSWGLMALWAPLAWFALCKLHVRVPLQWGVLFILGEQFSRAMWDPYVGEFLYRHFPVSQRATALAVNGLGQSVMKFFIMFLTGPLLDRVSFPVAIGGLLLIPLAVGGLGLKRIWKLKDTLS